ncbi:MAG: DNA repair protein RecO C-terminal domain-containing protein, partial [Alphaproteobacteria bacterium]|nr:DNA repair protein RecO C-terminal domain-containing protein [Alphaproteobacteria bacterium]
MKLESIGIIIGLRPFGERDMIAKILTQRHGVLAGMIKGAIVARKNKPLVGQCGNVSWNARLDSQLGVFHFESEKNLAAPIMRDAAALSFMNSAFALVSALVPERAEDSVLFNATEELLIGLVNDFLKFDNRPPTGAGAPTPPKGGVIGPDYSPHRGESETHSVSGGGQIYAPKRRYTERALANAQKLRREMTDAEKLLWHYLRDNKLGVAFRKQCPVDKYIADFACLEKKLIIELDGIQHYEEGRRLHDVERTRALNSDGYKIIRFDNEEIFKNMNDVLGEISGYLYPPTGAGAPTPPKGGVIGPDYSPHRGESETHSVSGGGQRYIDWEIQLLRSVGYALDLTKCSGCGRTDDLKFMSKKTARAVCSECAAPYMDQVFELPVDLTVTKFFLCRAAADMGAKIPMER